MFLHLMPREIGIIRLILRGGPAMVTATAGAVAQVVPVLVDAAKELIPVVANATKEVISAAADANKEVLPEVPAADATKEVISAAGDATKEVISAAGDATKEVISAAGDATKEVISAAGDATKEVISAARDATKEVISAAGDATKEIISAAGDATKEIISAAGDATKDVHPLVAVALVSGATYVAYKVANEQQFLQAITNPFTSIRDCFVTLFESGSLTITLMVENQLALDTILDLYNKGILIERVNQAVQEYGSKFNDPQPEFTDLKLLSQQTYKISEEDLQRIKGESKFLSSFIVEKGSITLDQKPSASSDPPTPTKILSDQPSVAKSDIGVINLDQKPSASSDPPTPTEILSDQPSVAKSEVGSITLVGKSSAFSDKPAKDMDTDQQDCQKHQGQPEIDSSLIKKYRESPNDAALFAELLEASYETKQECAKYFPSEFYFQSQNLTKEAVQGVACILRHVKQLEVLNLREKSLPPGSIQLILNAIKEGKVKMKKLNLFGNIISNDGAKSLSSIVEYVEELDLGVCELSSESIAIICNAISEKKCKIKKLHLSENTISNDEAKSLSSIVEYVEELHLGHCKLSSESIAIICNAISEKKCKIKKLHLSHNTISNDGAKSLSSIVEYVEELDLGDCKLSSESIAIICNAISEKKCKMKKLDLSGNSISNDGAKSLSSIVEFVEVLDLMYCGLTKEGKEVIKSKLGLPAGRVDFG